MFCWFEMKKCCDSYKICFFGGKKLGRRSLEEINKRGEGHLGEVGTAEVG